MEIDINALVTHLRRAGTDIYAVDIHGVPHAAVPDGVELKRLDIEQFLPAPAQIKRDVVASDVRGFVDYVNKFKNQQTQLYCNSYRSPALLARIDDHLPEAPSHVRHNCSFPCTHSEEWTRWTTMNTKSMGQQMFGTFLENNASDVIKPAAAEMVRLATEFRTVTMTEFGQATRLQSGQVQLNYVEKDVAGQMVLPEKFEIAVPVFEGMAGRYPIEARLRYRVPRSSDEAKGLQLWYELDRPDVVLRKAYDDLLAHVEGQVGVTIFRAL